MLRIPEALVDAGDERACAISNATCPGSDRLKNAGNPLPERSRDR
jgi:hypothetical protein